MRFAEEDSTKPLSTPFTYCNTKVGPFWDYAAHAQLAYALISTHDAVIPGAGDIQYAPAPFFKEAIRQCSILAIERSADGLFEDPKREKAGFVASGKDTPEAIIEEVGEALERCDRLVYTYFQDGVHFSKADGAKLIGQIIDNRSEARYADIEEDFLIN